MDYGLIPDDPHVVVKCVLISVATVAFIFIFPRIVAFIIKWMGAA